MPFDAITRSELSDDLAQKRDVARRVDGALRGQVNWVGEVTLEEGALGTTIEDDRVNENSHISLTPLTIEAAAVASKCFVYATRPGTPWTPNRIGEFVVVHPAPSNDQCLFRYSVKG